MRKQMKLSAAQLEELQKINISPVVASNMNRTYKALFRHGFVNRAYPTNDHMKAVHTITDSGREYLATLDAQPMADEAGTVEELATPEYLYLCMNRPAMWETVPAGYVAVRSHADSEYGVVVYPEPLTLEQRRKYQLRLVSPMFEPVKGLHVRFYINAGQRGYILTEDTLDQPHEKNPGFWYTENEGHIRLADMEVIETTLPAVMDTTTATEPATVTAAAHPSLNRFAVISNFGDEIVIRRNEGVRTYNTFGRLSTAGELRLYAWLRENAALFDVEAFSFEGDGGLFTAIRSKVWRSR